MNALEYPKTGKAADMIKKTGDEGVGILFPLVVSIRTLSLQSSCCHYRMHSTGQQKQYTISSYLLRKGNGVLFSLTWRTGEYI